METTPQVAPAAPAISAPASEPVQTPASGDASPGLPSISTDGEPPKEQITKHSRLQSRFDELTRQRYEEQRAREAAEAKLAEIERERTQAKQFQDIDAEFPDINRYESLAAYNRAVADWSSKRSVAMAHAEWEKRSREQGEQQAQQYAQAERQRMQQEQITAAIERKMEVGRTKYPDFMDAVANPELPPIRQHPMLLGALMECANSHDIAYALAKNPAEYERFYAMRNPWQIARELNALDTKFTGSGATTQAPPPPPRLNGSSTGKKDYTEMSTEEHVKAYLGRKR